MMKLPPNMSIKDSNLSDYNGNDETNGTENDFEESICVPDELNTTNCKEWKVVNVNPIEALVHSELKLQLTVIKQSGIDQPPPWCFLRTPDSNIEIMSTSWTSDSKISCSGFNPVVPGIFTVSLSSVMTPTIFDKGISLKVVSKHPVALKAEYSFHFDTIFIYFDENIEFYTTCTNVFPKQYHENFGIGFNCSTRGNIFVVKMGTKFKLIDSLIISPVNKICLAGSESSEFCLPARPLSLPISKPKNETRTSTPLGEFVVLRLAEPYLHQGRSITADNFFTSVLLAEKLVTKGTILVGTIRANKRELQKPAKIKKDKMKLYFSEHFKSGNCTLTLYKSPNLSLYIDSVCGDNSTQKHMNLKLLPSNRSNLALQNQTFQIKSSGKFQRRNLMIWRIMRQFQSKIASRVTLQMNEIDVLPLLENLSLLDNTLNADAVNKISPTAKVSVFAHSSPTTSFIVAEANVTFCEDSMKLFRYKWYVNEKYIFRDGKLITMEDLSPGKYVIKCIIVAHNSSDILGEGWTTIEVLANCQRVLIVPSEITVGTADDIFLRAVPWEFGSSIAWTCRKNLDELCFTTNQKLVSDVFELNFPDISIPGGTLPVGNYIWTVKNACGLNTAKIFIKPVNVTAIGVEIPSVYLTPSKVIVLRGIVSKVECNCRAWWSSVRQKGFNYFNLQTVERLENNSITEQYPIREVFLEIPSVENQNTLEPDAFYMFTFQIFCPTSSKNPNGSLDYIKIPLGVRNRPRVSPLIVEPLEGKAMITNFLISGADAYISVEKTPLLFEWSYIDTCGVVVPIERGASFKNFTTYLPPGELKLIVKVCSGKEICTTLSSPIINVIQAFEFPAGNFNRARHRIEHLMTSGDTLEAFGLAITAFKSLMLIVEPKAREDFFSTVEEAIKVRINDLIMRMRFDSKASKLSLEFFEQAVKVAQYFRKDSDIMNLLMEFNNNINILKSVSQRNA